MDQTNPDTLTIDDYDTPVRFAQEELAALAGASVDPSVDVTYSAEQA